MIPHLLRLPAVLAFAIATAHAEPKPRLHFPVAGFSIEPLEAPLADGPRQALMMFLPVSDNFAANVNVQIQPYKEGIDAFVKLSLGQFEQLNFKAIQHKLVNETTAIIEYSGEMQGRQMHWYARMEKVKDHVCLATATATEEQWKKSADALKKCVDSLRGSQG